MSAKRCPVGARRLPRGAAHSSLQRGHVARQRKGLCDTDESLHGGEIPLWQPPSSHLRFCAGCSSHRCYSMAPRVGAFRQMDSMAWVCMGLRERQGYRKAESPRRSRSGEWAAACELLPRTAAPVEENPEAIGRTARPGRCGQLSTALAGLGGSSALYIPFINCAVC